VQLKFNTWLLLVVLAVDTMLEAVVVLVVF
jgi:hypothetical protein